MLCWVQVGRLLWGQGIGLFVLFLFLFYLGNSVKSAVRTDWVLHECALVHHFKASLVLCRVFVKSCRGNSISDNVLSSCTEESISAVHNISTRHDGFLTPDIAEAKVHNDCSADTKNDLSRYSVRLGRELDGQVTTRPLSISSFQFPSGSQSNELVFEKWFRNHKLNLLEEFSF